MTSADRDPHPAPSSVPHVAQARRSAQVSFWIKELPFMLGVMPTYTSIFGGSSSFIRRVFSSLTRESMLWRNSCRSVGVISLDAISSHAKRTLSFRPLMSRISFSCSVTICTNSVVVSRLAISEEPGCPTRVPQSAAGTTCVPIRTGQPESRIRS
jgi:hypothetical protein